MDDKGASSDGFTRMIRSYCNLSIETDETDTVFNACVYIGDLAEGVPFLLIPLKDGNTLLFVNKKKLD